MKHLLLCLCALAFTVAAQNNRVTEDAARRGANAPAAAPRVNPPAPPPAPEAVEVQPNIQRSMLRATVDADVMRGYRSLSSNQFAQAREAYSQVLANNPTQRDALLGIAYAHYALGNSDQALSTLRRLVDLYPRDSDALSALFLIGGGDAAAEETRFKQLLDRSENPASLHYALGVLYFDQGRYGEAERAFSRASALAPNQPDYAYNLALALDQLGRARDAARQYVLALNLANQSNAVFSRDVARARLRILTANP